MKRGKVDYFFQLSHASVPARGGYPQSTTVVSPNRLTKSNHLVKNASNLCQFIEVSLN